MKRLGDFISVYIVRTVQTFLSPSSSAEGLSRKIQISKRSFRSSALPVSIALGVLLTGLTLSPSMRGMFTRTGSVTAFAETISTFQSSDCATPKTTWNLGETACAGVSGAVGARRILWVAPNGDLADISAPFTDSGSDTYAIPTTGAFAQVGTWSVVSLSNSGAGFAVAKFVVRDPNLANADISVSIFGPSQASPGGNATYRFEVTNHGPDAAQAVTLTVSTPTNTTFVSSSCGSLSGATCTIGTLAAGDTATVAYVFNVNSGAEQGSSINTTATVATSTNESTKFLGNNTATNEVIVFVGTASQCTINCPANVNVNNDPNSANPCVATATYSTPSTSGDCSDPETGQTQPVVCSPPSGSLFAMGATEVVCSTGGFSCSFTVIVHETRTPVQPTIICPSSVSVVESSSGSGFAVVNYAPPTTTGNCVTAVCEPPSGSIFELGTTTVTCSGTDSSNQSANCSFTVTVTSGDVCTLTCPNDITQTSSDCSPVTVTYAPPTTTGNCGTVTCNPPSGSQFPVGVSTVTCTSSEGPACDFTVTVNPSTPPTITTCASNKTISADANCEATIPNLLPEVTTTGCSVIKSQAPAAGSIVGPGTVTVTITAENSAGEAACTATVTVQNTVTTTITCPADITVPNDQDQCGAVVSYTVPTGSNSCSSVSVDCSPASGAFFSIGDTNVTCTATDVSGNIVTCTFKVTVNDTQQPTITCPANITQNNDQDKCYAVVNYDSPTATDNCPGVTTNCSPASGTQFAVGTTTVNCTATDTAGHTATCSFTVTVNDSQSPKITCPSNIAVGLELGSSTVAVNYQPTVSDNCPGVTSSCTPASGSQFAAGTATVNCTATDTAGHAATCSFTVTVTDNQPPTITCPASITQSNDPNQCGAVVTYPPPTVTDNSPGATASCSPASGSFFPVGVTTVTCTATDVGGNHATCSFTVTVRDTQPPTITCPANITAPNTAGQCSASVNPGAATASDNCPGVTVVGARSDGLALNATYPVGTTTITWTARDAAGNQTSCTQTIVVNDTQTPTITMRTGQQMEFQPPNHQYQTVRVSDFVVSASDNCSGNLTNSVVIASISSDEPDDAPGDGDGNTTNDIVIAAGCKSAQVRAERQGSGNGRVYTITFRVRDASGNVKTATAKVGVPKSQNNNNGAIDDGPDHTVNATCP